jgi:hypothetical protein
MSDWMLLYLWTRLDAVQDLLTAVGAFGVFAITLALIPILGEGVFNEWKGRLIRALIAIFAVFLVATAIPTKSDMAIIVGGKFALDAARSETAKEVSSEVLEAIRAQLRKASK